MSFLVKRIGLPIAEQLRGMHVSKYLGELLRTQWLSSDELRHLQNAKLARLIDHAYRTVPLYREIMDRGGLCPADITCVEDLPKLPILTKEIIRANYPDKTISSAFDASKLIVMTSSGSTGEPFRYSITNDEKAVKWAGLYRFWNWAGYEMGDRIVNLTAFPPRAFKGSKVIGFLESRFSGILGLPANELYKDNADEFVAKIAAFRPKTIRGYASSLYYLAEAMSEKGVKMDVNSVCTTGETLFDFQRELMESFYGCRVYDGYGGEGMEIAGQCGEDPGYHISAESVILETVGPDGKVCEPGVEGQVVLTDLNHYSMPFIRYNIQDMAVRSDRVCSCGRGLPMLDKLSGRLTDIGVSPSGKSIHVHFFTALFMRIAPRVTSFQIVQERPDLIVVTVVPGEGFDQAREEIVSTTQGYVGADVQVELVIVDEIPPTSGGKRRLFISKCGIRAAGAELPGQEGF
jgi:phenylacetate-CoA ligase